MKQKEYDVVVRSVIETHYTIKGTSILDAEAKFNSKVYDKKILIPGVVQSGPVVTLKVDPHELLPEGYELEIIEPESQGAPSFYRVRDKASGASYKSPAIGKAISKVNSFLSSKAPKDPLE